MFPPHDPYFHLIKSVAEINGCNIKLVHNQQNNIFPACRACNALNEKEIEYFLYGLKAERQNLIDSLKESYVHIDYEKRFLRTAYMLLYFPFYIEPIYYVTLPHLTKILPGNNSEIKICFIGGGPLPELLGLGKALSTVSIVKKIKCTVLDLVQHWSTERKYCTQRMLKQEYFPNCECVINHQGFNLWKEITVSSFPSNVFEESDIIISQNCINDCPKGSEKTLYKNFQIIWNKLKKGSSLIIIDLYYEGVRNLLVNLQRTEPIKSGEIIKEVEKEGPSELSRINNNALNFSFSKCKHIEDNLGQTKLYVKYYSAIFKKVN